MPERAQVFLPYSFCWNWGCTREKEGPGRCARDHRFYSHRGSLLCRDRDPISQSSLTTCPCPFPFLCMSLVLPTIWQEHREERPCHASLCSFPCLPCPSKVSVSYFAGRKLPLLIIVAYCCHVRQPGPRKHYGRRGR